MLDNSKIFYLYTFTLLWFLLYLLKIQVWRKAFGKVIYLSLTNYSPFLEGIRFAHCSTILGVGDGGEAFELSRKIIHWIITFS